MISKACLKELAACNVFLLKIKPNEAVKNIEKLISSGEQLFLKYQEYDKSVLSTINFLPVESNGFSRDRSVPSKKGVDPIIYIYFDKENKRIEARVFENIKNFPQKFYLEYIPVEDMSEDKIDLQRRTEIIKKLSLHNAVSFSAFDFEAYKTWKADCMQMLDNIDCDSRKSWFPEERYDLTDNKDRAFLGLFSRQIASLKTKLTCYSASKKISLKWLRFKSNISIMLKSVGKKIYEHWLKWVTGLIIVILLLLWHKIEHIIQPYYPDFIKSAIKKLSTLIS